jgi:hypothetical protein
MVSPSETRLTTALNRVSSAKEYRQRKNDAMITKTLHRRTDAAFMPGFTLSLCIFAITSKTQRARRISKVLEIL